MLTLLIFGQFFLSILLIGIILMQKGKGASMGVSFGAGASETVFGSRGPLPFMAKLTWFLGILFVVNAFLINNALIGTRTKSVTTNTQIIHKKAKKLPTLPINPNIKIPAKSGKTTK
ncbi:MAG: preprotein translocase subunit SecG [bacterium]|nr:MAG: preprotein translocase subunit SecG [bacterium]